MRVLVTGHRGYVGAVLVSVLHHQHFDVTGLDADWFEGCDFGRTFLDVPGFQLDVRDVQFADLLSFDAVVHLAAVSNDACSEIDPALAEDINLYGAVRLAELSKQAKVGRFVFASTCAVYGRSDRHEVTEEDPPAPLSAYAQGKRTAEQQILCLADDAFSPTVLRFGTLYGLSPRLRVDTFVNEFCASAVAAGSVDMHSAGTAWRPVVHVEDAARAVGAVLRARQDNVHAQILNVADRRENHRVYDVAARVCEATGAIYHAGRQSYDERSYRVDGSRLLNHLPGFHYRWSLERGIRQLLEGLTSAGFTAAELRGDRYRRELHLQQLLEHQRLDSSFRTLDSVAAA